MALDDSLLLEAVAKQGGYEAVEEGQAWPAIAKALGQRKTDAMEMKKRYEDILFDVAAQEEQDEENEMLERTIGRDYEVDSILDDRIEAGEKQYLIKWKDCSAFEDQSTWEPSGNLAGSHQLVQAYEAQKHARACAAENAFGDACEELEGAAGSGACGGDSMAGTATSKRKLPRQADQWIKVERVKPKSDEPGSELCWLVACAPPTLQQLVTNSQLRREAPQLLLDFYEARLTLPKQQ